jgi:hypothetical protein
MKRKVGLVFLHEDKLTLQIRRCSDNKLCHHESLTAADIDAGRASFAHATKKTVDWILIVPTYQCITRFVTLPSSEPAELHKMLEYEITHIAPCNTQPWTWDFLIVNEHPSGTSTVMVVLSPVGLIETHTRKLAGLGIRPKIITTTALFYSLVLTGTKTISTSKPVACFCIRSRSVDFFVVENHRLIFARGVRLTDRSALDATRLRTHIHQSFAMFAKQPVSTNPDVLVMLTSNGSRPDSARIVRDALTVFVHEVDLDRLYADAPRTLAGLYARDRADCTTAKKSRINLLPVSSKQKHRKKARRRRLSLNILRVCFLVLLAWLSLKTAIRRKARLLDRCRQRVSLIGPAAERLRTLQQQLTIIQQQLQRTVSMLEIISELYIVLSDDVTIHYLAIGQNERLVIRAQAKRLSQAFDSIGPLERSQYFSNVRQTYANQRQIQDSVLIDFEITAELRKEPFSGQTQ